MRRVLLAAALLVSIAVPAHAVTVRELVDLSKAGLSDDILIALVDAEKSVFRLTAAEVQSLKREGLSDRVLLHLLQTPSIREHADRVERLEQLERLERVERAAQEFEPARPARAEAPGVVYIDRVETIAVPVYIPLPIVIAHPHPERPEEPAYWGWGGKRRPGSWQEPSSHRR